MAGEQTKGGKQRALPLRRCVGCGQSFPKKELIRVVRSSGKEEGSESKEFLIVSLDFTGKKAGRGAYICKNLACFKKARKARRFENNLECSIPPEVYELLEAELSASEPDGTG